jgi:hypothetical protein
MLGQALLSTDARNTEGTLLLAIVAVELGGTCMLRMRRCSSSPPWAAVPPNPTG